MNNQRSQREPYHEGERTVQSRAGVHDAAQRVAEMVQPSLSENMQAFLSHQPLAVAATVDYEGRVWMSLLTGEPGFMTAETANHVRIDVALASGDPLAEHQRGSMHMGILAINPQDRSRLRVNGTAHPTDEGGLELSTQEVYPNCPKYIQRRSLTHIDDRTAKQADVRRSKGLDDSHREWLRTADTFFIGSAHPDRGADASHRGGDPGFIRVEGDALVFPDYPGNKMFCTLGNLTVNPSVGLLFVDFETGRTLQLAGKAEIIWDGKRVREHDRAERLIEITVSEAIEAPDGNPLRWELEERSPFNP
jgi:predicted pyridoxine 5'-phosphate oxidase superfamily flavin-nucleotide-binding protein